MKRSEAEKFIQAIIALREGATDMLALQCVTAYPSWESLAEKQYVAEKAGFRFKYNDKLYKTISENTQFAMHWIPDNGTESMYIRIDEIHDGSLENPIPYEGNMILENSKYYSQDGVVYLCTRDTGNAVYNPLSELVGLYVQIA